MRRKRFVGKAVALSLAVMMAGSAVCVVSAEESSFAAEDGQEEIPSETEEFIEEAEVPEEVQEAPESEKPIESTASEDLSEYEPEIANTEETDQVSDRENGEAAPEKASQGQAEEPSVARELTEEEKALLNDYGFDDISAIYDYAYYLAANPSVAQKVGTDPAAVLGHFLTEGMKAGLQGCENFDVTSYRLLYQDLRGAYGSNLASYYRHYLKHGQAEKRNTTGVDALQNPVSTANGKDYSLVYDYQYYLSRYADLAKVFKDDDFGLLNHFLNYGMREERQASAGFDEKSYRREYQDLRVAFRNSKPLYYEHYLTYGNKEGRNTLGVTQIKNPLTKEGEVDYAPVYDFSYYLQKYADLRAIYADNDVEALHHFVTHGMKEQRKASSNFDEIAYRSAYEDVRKAYRTNYPSYYLHYITNGQAEGRTLTTKAALDAAGIQYSPEPPVLFERAAAVLDRVGWTLRAAFNWSTRLTYYGHNPYMPDTPSPGIEWYADYGFKNLMGNCYVMAATFYEMAVELGYSARQISGSVPLRSGGYGPHSWVEIDLNGGTYVFDPNFTNETGRNGYQIHYGMSGTWAYNKISVMTF